VLDCNFVNPLSQRRHALNAVGLRVVLPERVDRLIAFLAREVFLCDRCRLSISRLANPGNP